MGKGKAKNNTVTMTSLVPGTISDIPGKIWRLRSFFLKKTLGVLGFLTTPSEMPEMLTKFHPGNSTKPQNCGVTQQNPLPIPPIPSFSLEMSRLETNIPGTLSF